MARTMILFSFKYFNLSATVSQRLLKCMFLLYEPNDSFGDNAIDKPRYLACIQHEHQNGTFQKQGIINCNMTQSKFLFKHIYFTYLTYAV